MIDQILALGEVSDADAAAILSSVTVSPIDLQPLENLLSDEGLAWRDEITGNWAGPVPAVVAGGGVLGEGVAELLRHLNKIRSVHIESNKPEWALKASGLLAGLVAAAVISQDQADAVVALGGGLAHEGLDEAAVQATRDEDARIAEEYRQNEKYGSLFNVHVSPFMGGLHTDADIAIALRNLADAYEA